MNRQMLRSARGGVVAVLTGVVAAAAALAASDQAFAVGGSAADPAYAYVVKVNVGDTRSCTGVLVDSDIVATSRECFQIGSTPVVSGPPPATSTVVPRPDQAITKPRAVNYLYVRDDRDLVLARIESGLVTPAKVSANAPAANETLRVLGYGRTADEWVPDLPHTAQVSVQDVSSTGIGLTPIADGSICKGDAGGPVIRENSDGTAELVAVVSTSWQGGCFGETSTRRDATATRVDDLGDWIKQFKSVTLTGVVQAGVDSGCLIVHVGDATYNLVGGDSSAVKVGANVHLAGYPAPSTASTCTQGTRLQVTDAFPVVTLFGTVTAGVEHGCRVLTSGGSTYQLVGGDPTVVKAGAELTVTGYKEPMASICMQGTRFVVLSAVSPQQVSLRAHANSKYVTAENAGASALIANRTAIGSWEVFDEIDLGDGNIALRARINMKYVCADNAGASALIANQTAIGSCVSFQLIRNTDGSISLKAQANGKYVTADNAGASALIANRTAIGPWEEFDLVNG